MFIMVTSIIQLKMLDASFIYFNIRVDYNSLYKSTNPNRHYSIQSGFPDSLLWSTDSALKADANLIYTGKVVLGTASFYSARFEV